MTKIGTFTASMQRKTRSCNIYSRMRRCFWSCANDHNSKYEKTLFCAVCHFKIYETCDKEEQMKYKDLQNQSLEAVLNSPHPHYHCRQCRFEEFEEEGEFEYTQFTQAILACKKTGQPISTLAPYFLDEYEQYKIQQQKTTKK